MRKGKLAVVLVAGLLGSCGIRHDAVQLVHKDPATVYAALDESFSAAVDAGNSGIAAQRGQTTTIERVPGKSLDLKVVIEGKQALRLTFGIEPENGGSDTRLSADIDVDQEVLRASIRKTAGGDVAMPTMPSFAFDLAMQKMLKGIAAKLERGEPLGSGRHALAMANPSSGMEGGWGERDFERPISTSSAAPMVDPNAAAERYLPSQ
jgi:hypothetical protein